MVDNSSLRTMIRDRERGDSPHWSEGECDRCGRESVQVLATTALDEFDELCLVCSDREAEDGDLAALVGGRP